MGKTYQSITIDAPVEKVWETIRDFHDGSWAPNVITKLEVKGDTRGDQVGAGRVLNEVFHETLLTLDENGRTFTYSIDEGPGPLAKGEVDGYTGRVSVQPTEDGSGAVVEWTSSWEKNDDAVYEFSHPIYLALLDDMKKSIEG